MELIQMGSFSRGFAALMSEKYKDLDDNSKHEKQQHLMLGCVNLFASNPMFWDKAFVTKEMATVTIWGLLSMEIEDSDEQKRLLKLMLDSIPCIDYEPVKKGVIITPGGRT